MLENNEEVGKDYIPPSLTKMAQKTLSIYKEVIGCWRLVVTSGAVIKQGFIWSDVYILLKMLNIKYKPNHIKLLKIVESKALEYSNKATD